MRSFTRKFLSFGAVILLIFVAFAGIPVNVSAQGIVIAGIELNLLITDTGNNRVIEVDANDNIVWQMTGLNNPNDAERLANGNTLIADTGNNRVIEVNETGSIVWQKTGLSQPYDVERLANGNTLITESGNNKVIEVDINGIQVWQCPISIAMPIDAERLANGNTLITFTGANMVLEVLPNGNVVWSKVSLQYPMDAERLPNGNTLIVENYQVAEYDFNGNAIYQYYTPNAKDIERIPPNTFCNLIVGNGIYDTYGGNYCQSIGLNSPSDVEIVVGESVRTLITDSNNHRVIEVDLLGNIVWSYSTGLLSPQDAERLDNGNTLIADRSNNRVIEINETGTIVWQKTSLNAPVDVERLENDNTLITEWDRVLEVNHSGSIVWQMSGLVNVKDAERLDNGNTLIADYSNNRVIEINQDGYIVWMYSYGYPCSVERIGNGNTLIAYYGWPSSYFIREVDPEGNTIWEKSWSYQISDAKRLQNGNTLIAEPGNNRIVEINSLGIIVWQMDGFYLPNDVERLWDIQNRPPTADAGGPYGAINGTELRLDASRSVDPDWDELQYRWDFDNDGNWDTGYATEPTVSHLYYDYVGLVKVEVDDGEYKSTDTAKVTMGSYGKILITEFWGQRVLEVDVNGNSNVVWENTIPSTQKPRDIEILDNGNILLTEGNTYSTGGFVTELDNYNNIVWQMTNLNSPYDAERLDNGNTLITEFDGPTGFGRVIEVNSSGSIVWEKSGLNHPTDAERLPNGNTLIGLWHGSIIEVDIKGNIIWQKTLVSYCSDIEKLDNGNLLVTDSNYNKVVECDYDGNYVWICSYPGDYSKLYGPWDAERLPNGNTLITDTNNHRVIDVDVEGNVVWEKACPTNSYPYDIEVIVPIDRPPVADASGPYTGYEATPLVFDATGSSDPDNTPLQYRWDFDNDGTWDTGYSTDPRIEHIWYEDYSGTVLLEVFDGLYKSQNTTTITITASNTLIADTENNLVLEVDHLGNTIWQMGELNHPMDAERLANGNTLITDTKNHRVYEIDTLGNIVWEKTGLNYPIDADRLDNGNTLITDHDDNLVIEVDYSGNIVWQMGFFAGFKHPYDAERLDNGNTLISLTTNARNWWGYGAVIEFNSSGKLVSYFLHYSDTGSLLSYDAERLDNGNTLVTDHAGGWVYEVNTNRQIVWDYRSSLVSWSVFDAERLDNGNTLIAERGRVLEVDSSENIVWSYSTGTCTPCRVMGGTYPNNVFINNPGLITPYDVERLANGNTLISEWESNRIIEIDSAGNIVWQRTGGLANPNSAEKLANGNILIADTGNNRVIEVDNLYEIKWQKTGLAQPHSAKRMANTNTLISNTGSHCIIEVNDNGIELWNYTYNLNSPYDAERLKNGNILIADTGNNRVLEVDEAKNMVWEMTGLNYPTDVEELPDGNILITDTKNDRVIEIDSTHDIVWQKNNVYQPHGIERLHNGNTLIAETNYDRVIEVDRSGNIVWQRSGLNHPGSAKRSNQDPRILSTSIGYSYLTGLDSFNNIVWPHWTLGSGYGGYDVEKLDNGNTLTAGGGYVTEVDDCGNIVWQRGGFSNVRDVERLDNGNTLIADFGNYMVSEIDSNGQYIWKEYNFRPYDAERLDNGNTLIADLHNNQVIEVNKYGLIAWEYSISYPYDVERLKNGNTLITTMNRVYEVDHYGNTVWQSLSLSNAKDAERLPNGNTLIAETGSTTPCVIEVDEANNIISQIYVEYPYDVEYLFPSNVFNVDKSKYFHTIQEAIDDAEPGDTIEVRKGSYYENTYYENILIDKSLTLRGENKDIITIDGGGTGDVIIITADDVIVSGFTITDSGSNSGDAGVEFDSIQNCIISDNLLINNNHGAYLTSSNNCTIDKNLFINNVKGINIDDSHYNQINSNDITNNEHGIYLYAISSNNTIEDNSVSNCDQGIYLNSWRENFVYHNNFVENTVQIYDYGFATWNNLDNEGNYWSDYSGEDDGSGGRTAKDGIGDTDLPHSGVDDYPLMYPWGSITNIDLDKTYTCIQKAIDDAGSNNTIKVLSGTYNENIVIDKSIFLFGEDTATTIIDGGGSGDVVRITGDGCNLSMFTIQNSGQGADHAGIEVDDASYCELYSVVCINNKLGLHLDKSSFNTITYSTFSDNFCGLHSKFSNVNYIHHNNFINNSHQTTATVSTNYWEEDYEGNYWDDYFGTDLDKDGIGDTNLPHQNVDNYPLMHFWGSIQNIDKRKIYPTIVDAIDDADPSNTIKLLTGNYYENIVIDKPLTLTGQARDTAVIDGSGTGTGIEIHSNDVIISSLSVINSGNDELNAGIMVDMSDYCRIENVNLKDNGNFGIYVDQSDNCWILNNYVTENGIGIYLNWSNKNELGYNSIYNNDGNGIQLTNSGNSGLNYVHNNSFYNNGLSSVQPDSAGLFLLETLSKNNLIENNLFIDNNQGLHFSGTGVSGNIIRGNTLRNNVDCGIEYTNYAGPNTFYHNNFINNNVHLIGTISSDIWYMDYPIGGNYWDTYAGEDKKYGPDQDQDGKDGIGDTPYPVTGGGQDKYPWMEMDGFKVSTQPYIGKDKSSIDLDTISTAKTFKVWNEGTGILNYTIEITDVTDGIDCFRVEEPTTSSSNGYQDKNVHIVKVLRYMITPGHTVYGTITISHLDTPGTPHTISLEATRLIQPSIAKDKDSLNFGISFEELDFNVWNDDTGLLTYEVSISEKPEYFSVLPTTGSSDTVYDENTHTVNVLDINRHTVKVEREKIDYGQSVTGEITITSSVADDSPKTITLSLSRTPIILTAENLWDGKRIKLEWSSISGSVGRVSIYRNSTYVATVSGSSYIDYVPEPGQWYEYVLKDGGRQLSERVEVKAEIIVVLVRGYTDFSLKYRVDENYWKWDSSQVLKGYHKETVNVTPWLEAHGITCWEPPQGKEKGEGLYGWKTPLANAWELKKFIDEMRDTDEYRGKNIKINLIGHSMGGLTSRYFTLQNPGLVDNIICIATPHTGSTVATLGHYITHGIWSLINPATPYLTENKLFFFNKQVRNLGDTKLYSSWSVNAFDISGHWKLTLGFICMFLDFRYFPLIYLPPALSDGATPTLSAIGLINEFIWKEWPWFWWLPVIVQRTKVKMDGYFYCAYDHFSGYRHPDTLTEVLKILGFSNSRSSISSTIPLTGLPRNNQGSDYVNQSQHVVGSFNGEFNSLSPVTESVQIGNSSKAYFQAIVSNPDCTFTLTDPNGQTYDPTYASSNPNVTYTYGDNYIIYEINSTIPGTWKVHLSTTVSSPESVYYGITAFENENIVLNAYPNSSWINTGDGIAFGAVLKKNNVGLSGANVQAEVTYPDGSTTLVTLHDDGAHYDANNTDGIYANTFSQTSQPGTYDVLITATGTSTDGNAYKRTTLLSFTVTPPDIVFAGDMTDTGVDTNGNGLFETLEFSVPVTVNEPGDYLFTASLLDKNGESIDLPSSETITLPSGSNILNLAVDAKDIVEHNVDGPFTLTEIEISNASTGLTIATRPDYTTPYYAVTDFEPLDEDGDGVPDILEQVIGTNTELPDTDFDGVTDFDEIDYDGNASSYDPNNDLNPTNCDTDYDGMDDGWEIYYNLDPLNDDGDNLGDDDIDNLTNLQEFQNGTDPFNPDTDGDGVLDGLDNCKLIYNPDQSDIDADGIGDACDNYNDKPVHNLDKDTYYAEIQEGIDDADSGDMLEVGSGVYNENLVINKTLTLIGDEHETTIIDGNGTGDVVHIENAKFCNLTGFTIRNSGSGSSDAGIEVEKSKHCRLEYLNCTGNYHGIYLDTSSSNILAHNMITLNSHGITLSSSAGNRIFHNNLINNTYHADLAFGNNKWEFDFEGNYWDDYAGEDLDDDGIGDTELPHLGLDFYPLMVPWSPNSAPEADAGGPYEGYEAEEILVDASASYDTDGDALYYRWDFDNDGTWDTEYSTDPTAVHTWYDDHSGEVAVEVYDGEFIAIDTAHVDVFNVAPTLSIDGPSIIDEGAEYILELYYDEPGEDTITKWEIGWGDGNIDFIHTNPPTASHTYADGPNNFTISAKATDEDGTYDAENTVSVSVNNVEPTLTISGAPGVDEDAEYILYLSSFDPGDDTISHWEINWGDGNIENISGNPPSASHVYTDGPNSFVISANATDEDGTYWAGNTVSVIVNNIAPTLSISGASSIDEGAVYTLFMSSNDPGDDIITQWEVNWGDGNIEFISGDPSSANHTYADGPNLHQISAKATDEDGTYDAENVINVTVNNVAPTLTLSGQSSVDEGSVYTLGLSSYDPGDDTIWKWRIYWGDGNIEDVSGDPPSVTHIYADGPNEYNISAQAFDEDGSYNTSNEIVVTVNNIAPTLTLSGASNVDEGSVYALGLTTSDPGDDTITKWIIDWGDGDIETVPGDPLSATHIYADGPNYYTVTANATDEDGTYNTGNNVSITINNVAPTLTLSGASSVDEGSVYTLGFSSYDPGEDTITKWVIDWGDSDIETVPGDPPSATHTYADGPNYYTITANATDEDGTYDAGNNVSVTINNVAPTLTLSGASSIDEGSIYTLGLSSYDPGDDTITKWVIDWGDGDIETVPGDPPSATHTYADGPNYYMITANATDEDGTFNAVNSINLTVNNVPPTLTLSGASSVDEGSVYTLGLSSYDPGDDTITKWEINWGDGTIENVTGDPSSADHTYADGPNKFNISGKATDEDGTYNASNIIHLTVKNVAPTAYITNITQPFNEFILPYDVITFNGSGTDPGSDDLTFSWDWGDGSPNKITIHTNYPPTYPVEFQETVDHAYTESGEYIVTLTITDDDGGIGTAKITIIVLSPAEATQYIIDQIEDLELHQGIENSLISKLSNAIKSMNKEKDDPAMHQLSAFIKEAEAQKSKKISDEHAEALITATQWIINNIWNNGL